MGGICSHSVCYSIPEIPFCGYDPNHYPIDIYNYRRISSHPPLPSVANLSDWMGDLLSQELPVSPSLNSLCLLGSHNACSSSIPKSLTLSSISITQDESVSKQLEAGVRVLDIRVAPLKESKGFTVCHGPHRGHMLGHILQEIVSFVKEHKKEVLVIVIKYEGKSGYKMLEQDWPLLLSEMSSSLSHLALTKRDSPDCSLANLPLKSILAKKKNLLVFLNPNKSSTFDSSLMNEHPWLHFQAGLFTSYWYNTDSRATLFKKHSALLKEASSSLSTTQDPCPPIQLDQLLLTPQPRALPALSYLSGLSHVRVDQLTHSLHHRQGLRRHILNTQIEGCRGVVLDFVTRYTDINRFVVGVNWTGERMEVVQGVVKLHSGRIDVTNRLREKVVKQNSLWVVDWEEDIGVDFHPQAKLRLRVRLNGELLEDYYCDIFDDRSFLFNWENCKQLQKV